MPALSRGAAARLRQAQPNAAPVATTAVFQHALGLRENVHHLAEAVWVARDGCDAYTKRERTEVVAVTPQVDHVIEVSVAEYALVCAMCEAGVGAGAISMAAAQSAQTLRGALNDIANLNVTTARINQAKRGPFTAAMNRLRMVDMRGGSLRLVTLEQLARQGKARWLVDDGTWAAIESEVACSYDAFHAAVQEGRDDGLPWASALSAASVEELGTVLAKLGVL